MKNANKIHKTQPQASNLPSNEVNTDQINNGGGAPETLLQDEPSKGDFQAETIVGPVYDPAEAEKLGHFVATPVTEAKPLLTLEQRLKAIEALQQLATKRDNLLDRIAELEGFEIDLINDADDLESNHFMGCKLIIMDGKGRQFTTNTANLIRMTADFIKEACYAKKDEIEAAIVFPAA